MMSFCGLPLASGVVSITLTESSVGLPGVAGASTNAAAAVAMSVIAPEVPIPAPLTMSHLDATPSASMTAVP